MMNSSIYDIVNMDNTIYSILFLLNNNRNMQFLYSAVSSNELKALYILLPPAHLHTLTPSQLLNGAYNPFNLQRPEKPTKAPGVINVQ